MNTRMNNRKLLNDKGDVNENGKTAIDLDWQNNNSARASRYFLHFFAVTVKNNRFRLAKQQLCTCITLFCTFLCRYSKKQ